MTEYRERERENAGKNRQSTDLRVSDEATCRPVAAHVPAVLQRTRHAIVARFAANIEYRLVRVLNQAEAFGCGCRFAIPASMMAP
jgi:hypothetical protein